MEPQAIFLTMARGNGKSEMLYRKLKEEIKRGRSIVFTTKEEKNMEKKCKFKVGCKVINKEGEGNYIHTSKGFIGVVTDVSSTGTIIKVKGKSVTKYWPDSYGKEGEWSVDPKYFDLYVPHEGKILIMVDEKDDNKIIARDLLTNKTAEAKCNPKDEWDFNKGAKLALERLTKPEKPKYWTGKVVCVDTPDNELFTIGKVYKVEDGILRDNIGIWHHHFNSVEEINAVVWSTKFIEFKGEVTAP